MEITKEVIDKAKFIKNYRDNDDLRGSFNKLAIESFGINFEPWYQKGFWNDNYMCYSFQLEGQIIANVSANKMKLKWDGKDYEAIQIGTVMTLPAFRKKGLAYRLLDMVVKEWENKVDFIYLFGNDSALNLYKQFDMKVFKEHRFFTSMPSIKNEGKIRKLDLNNEVDLKLMVEMANKRVAQSDTIGIEDDAHLIMFYCHEWLADDLYYIEEKETILVLEEEDEVLHLYDVISKEVQEISEILELIDISKVEKVEIHFKPSKCKLPLEAIVLEKEDQTLLIRHQGIEPKTTFRFSEFSHA